MSEKFDLHRYDDILDLPHYTSPNRKRMARIDRAAQFSPFAALTGYDADVMEAARVTGEKLSLTDDMKELLDRKQQYLSEIIDRRPEITVTYFVHDDRKEGGVYRTFTGNLKRIDVYLQKFVFMDGSGVFIDDVLTIESDAFRNVL